MAEIMNCKRCGELFASSGGIDVCPKCRRLEEADFQKVYRFMTKRKNREATINEIVDGTGVEEEMIIKFMKQNRLHAPQYPNLAYPCEKCGQKITEGRLCHSCTSSIQTALKNHDAIEEVFEKNKQNELNESPIYYSMDKKKN